MGQFGPLACGHRRRMCAFAALNARRIPCIISRRLIHPINSSGLHINRHDGVARARSWGCIVFTPFQTLSVVAADQPLGCSTLAHPMATYVWYRLQLHHWALACRL